jgi:eukaryotic-like serine/threonine-protein kinase
MPEPLANPHPSRELLHRFGSGALPGPEADAIQGHVATCPVCSAWLSDQTRPPQPNHAPAIDPGQEATCAHSPVTSSPSEKLGADLPQRVGRYRLEQEIARGGMGQVVRVTDEAFQRPLAMKIALGADQMSRDAQDRFVREARVTGQLQHPGIPPVQEMGQLDDGRPYFIMKLIQGSDLRDLLRSRSSAVDDLPRFVAIFGQICQTLGYAHSHGIIHRDLKPANIMVGAFGEVQVMDWGLAKFLTPKGEIPSVVRGPSSVTSDRGSEGVTPLTTDHGPRTADPQQTAAGTVMGTSAYMAPEQARGEVDTLDARCDVFGLGGILCEILTGTPPFTAQTSMDNVFLAMFGDLSGALARLDACGADAELVDLAKRCLAADRENRPTHGGAVAEGVAQYQAALQERMKQAEIDKAAALVKVREERKRRRVSLALAAALVLLVVGGSACALWYQGEMARQEESKIRQDADKIQQDAKLALRREYLNKEVSAAVADAEQRRQDLLERLANQRQVNELLSDIDQWQRALKEARAAWRRARALADGSPDLVEKALAERLGKLEANLGAAEKDWEFGKACDDARLSAATLVDGKWDPDLAARRYPGIFAGAGVDVVLGKTDRIVAQIKQSPIRLVYLAALDDWAHYANPWLHFRLCAIANQVDTDAWRKEFRNESPWIDAEKLQALAAKVDFQEQSPQILVALGQRLASKKDGAMLLRKALADHPQDFWIFFNLGALLTDPVEREGCFRAALAIRPLSSPAHNNLGVALHDKKDVEGAIQHYRKALDINPNLYEAYANLGAVLYNDKKDVEGAIKLYRKGLEINPNNVMLHNNLGVALSHCKDVEGAIKHYRKALDINPNYAGAHHNLGNALRGKKDVEGAIKHYRMALDNDPNLAPAHVNLGTALSDKDVDVAIEHYRKALNIDPNYATAHNNLGAALAKKKDIKGAIKHFRNSLDINPNDAKAHYNLGLALVVEKDVEGAIQHFRKALDIDPNLPAEAHYNLGNLLRDKKDVEGAIKHYRKALDINPNSAAAHVNLGAALRDKKDVEGAIKHYRMALDINPNKFEAHVNLGVALLDKKDVEGAIKHCRMALDINPNSATAHVNLGAALRDKKDVEGAIKHFRMGLDIDPNEAEVHYALGVLLRDKKKDVEGAIKHFRMALDINPNKFEAHVNLGVALHDKKDVEGAIKHYRKALDINPNEALIHANLGAALYAKKDVEGAIKHFRKALDINPNDARTHVSLGTIFLLQKKDAEEAVKHFRKALDIDPNDARTHGKLGLALHTKRDVEGAIKHYRKALELDPKDPYADYNLGNVFLLEKKDPEEAIKHFRKAIDINPKLAEAPYKLSISYGAFGQALLVKGQFAEARAATLEGLKLLPAEHPQRKLAQEQLQRCDQLLALDKQLSLILNGEDPPNHAAELLALADLCRQYKHDYAAATRFYAGALEKEPRLANDLQNNLRYSAAGAASLAAAGKGKDADKLQDQDRTKLRQQALDWLRADLAPWRKQSQSGNVEEVHLLIQKLPHWQRDPDLAGVRDAKELTGLPKEERESWQQLWADLAQLLKETRARFIETPHQGTLTAKQTERVYEVELFAGKSYVLDLESSQFDSYLRLEDAKGKVLAENDDISPQDQNSRLIFTPTQTGVYRIIATSFQQQGTGAYTLTIREFTGPMRTKAGQPKSPESGLAK